MEKQIKIKGRLKGIYLEREATNSSGNNESSSTTQQSKIFTRVFLAVSFPQAYFRAVRNVDKNTIWWEYYHFHTRTIIAIKNEKFYITNDDRYVTFKIPALDLKIPLLPLFPESDIYIEFKKENLKTLPFLEEENFPTIDKKLLEFIRSYKKLKTRKNERPIHILVIEDYNDMINNLQYISIQYRR